MLGRLASTEAGAISGSVVHGDRPAIGGRPTSRWEPARQAASGWPLPGARGSVVAEVLTNVARYADATRVDVVAGGGPQQLRILVTDDGRGGADPGAGSGLRGLSDRVAALGGRLDVRSPAGRGTSVVARFPLVAVADG